MRALAVGLMVSLTGCGAALASGRARVHEVAVGGAKIEVTFTPGELDLADGEVLSWIEAAARAVTVYYGRFPVARPHIYVHPVSGRGVGHGRTNEDDGGEINVQLGRRTTRGDLKEDWVMAHEMVHLGFPSLAEAHHWMEEGSATYVEPIGRVRTGDLSAEQVWGDLVRGLPKGLPAAGDRGLDRTPTWGRTYWGGALYFLLADVEIRQRTGGKRGLEQALAAIVGDGGTIVATWEVARVLAVGDAATGVPVLRELYEKMRAEPAPVDLDGLWRRLGVTLRGGRVIFDESAPLAWVRRSITTGR